MIIHGQEIQSRDVEGATFHWDASRFAGLCNDLVWAETERHTGSIPLMTGRIFVADNGEDAEWIGTPRRGARRSGRFLRPGTNVFQYKKRSVSNTHRPDIARSLRSKLRGAIADVEERTGIGRRQCLFVMQWTAPPPPASQCAIMRLLFEVPPMSGYG